VKFERVMAQRVKTGASLYVVFLPRRRINNTNTTTTRMDAVEQPQSSAHSPDGDPTNRYIPSMIRPCMPVSDGLGGSVPGAFHLVDCGHILVIDDPDLRCGRNCKHAHMANNTSDSITQQT
jgi:hypothetical protein